MDSLVFCSAHDLAERIRSRRASASEVMDAHLAQIARHNGSLNALVTVDEARARERAHRADVALEAGEVWGPLHGVPFTAKDSLSTSGIRTTSGSPSLAEYVPTSDASVVARMKAAGAILLGKTNLPTFGSDSQTHNPIFGRTSNPWDLTRTTGGSTGGGAAAVATGLSPIELGSDWGGSLRAPAHYCGILALKPTEHRVPWTGHIPPLPGAPWGLRHLATIGPLARSVRDLDLVLRIISGPDECDWNLPPVPVGTRPEISVPTLRLAWYDDFDGVRPSQATTRALETIAEQLVRLGCRVERCLPPHFDIGLASELWGELRQMEMGSSLTEQDEQEEATRFQVSVDSEVPWLRGRARTVGATMRQYTSALMRRDRLIASLEQFLDAWDGFLCPVTTGPAFPHCPTGSPIETDGRMIPYWLAAGAYCMPFSTTGHPVVVLPVALSEDGLPIGVQMVGRLWHDAKLLAIAAQLEAIIPPLPKPPGY